MKVTWVPLREVLEIKRTPIDLVAGETYRRIGIFSWGKGMLRRDPASIAEMGSMKYFSFPIPSLIFSNIQAWEGAVALAGDDDAGFVCSSRFYPYVPREGGDVNLGYLLEFFRSEDGLALMRQASPGTQVRNKVLSRAALEAARIPLPSRTDQDRIAAYLASLDDQVAGLKSSVPHLMGELPRLLGNLMTKATSGVTMVDSLCANRQVVIHPGDDLRGAEEFVGLEHVESHTGRRIGGRAIGDESGRKLLFEPGQVTYGYLRPYLNKAWAADRKGLCSVEQFTLTPAEDVDPRVLSVVLRSEAVWRSAREATNNLQLPRLGLAALMTFQVPDVRGLAWEAVGPAVECLTTMAVRETDLRGRCLRLQASILPAARNQIFSAMR